VLVVGLGLDGESPRVDGVLGLGVTGVVSAVFTVRVSTAVFSTTYFLQYLAHSSWVLVLMGGVLVLMAYSDLASVALSQ
jgi:hypothetical protein